MGSSQAPSLFPAPVVGANGDRSLGEHSDCFRRHFLAQADRPTGWEDLSPETLSSLHRALLMTDATVRFLEARTGEPVVTSPISQFVASLEGYWSRWLEAPLAVMTLLRRVVIRGQQSDTPYAYAESRVLLARLPGDFLHTLDRSPRGLGEALISAAVESRRELLWFGRSEVPAWANDAGAPEPGHSLLTRGYRIMTANQPAVLVTEAFPPDSQGEDGTRRHRRRTPARPHDDERANERSDNAADPSY